MTALLLVVAGQTNVHLLIVYFLAFTLCGQQCNASTQDRVEEVLRHFSEREKQQLDLFFEEAVIYDSFGYTIFGKKPVSAIGFYALPQYSGPSWLIRDHISLFQGAKLCRKLNALIHDSRFAFKFQYDENDQHTFLYLINKPECINSIQNHIDIFRSILGPSLSPQQLLNEMLREDSNFAEVLQHHEGLQGILFGFGVKNSFLYHKREEIRTRIQARYIPPAHLPSNEILALFSVTCESTPTQAIPQEETLELQEYTIIQKCFQKKVKNRNPLLTFPLPSFVGDSDDPETQALLQHYHEVSAYMNCAYTQSNFLKVTLCKMLEK